MAHFLQIHFIMYKISCIHPTCRPELAKKTRKWLKLAKYSSQIEYITCYDSFDTKKIKQKILKNKNITEIFEPYSFGIVKKCNIAAKYAKANCIIVATDDTIPESNWDEKVLDATNWSKEIVLNTSDGTEHTDKRLYMVKTYSFKKDIINWVIFYIQNLLMFTVIIFIHGYLIKMM